MSPASTRRAGRDARSTLGSLLVVLLAAIWFLVLRPVSLGGPASYVIVSGVSMEPHLHSGDLVITHTADRYRVGDVVAFRVPDGQQAAGTLVIHRIVGGDARTGFVLQGDNKEATDPWQPTASDIVGRSWLAFPGSGRVLLALRQPTTLAIVAGVLAGAWFFASGGFGGGKRPEPDSDDAALGAVSR